MRIPAIDGTRIGSQGLQQTLNRTVESRKGLLRREERGVIRFGLGWFRLIIYNRFMIARCSDGSGFHLSREPVSIGTTGFSVSNAMMPRTGRHPAVYFKNVPAPIHARIFFILINYPQYIPWYFCF